MLNYDRINKKIIIIGLYLILFLPLFAKSGFPFYSDYFHFPFIFPRTILFRMVIEILFIFYLPLAIYYPQYRPKKNILFYSLAIYVGAAVLTSFTGINFYHSWWSNMERMTGVFNFLHLFAFFLILTGVIKGRQEWFRFLKFSVIISSLVGLYALGQRMGIKYLFETGLSRTTGTIGNAAFLASYLLFNIIFILIFLPAGKNFPEKAKRIWFYTGCGLVLIINFLAFLSSQTRGAFIGLAFGFLVFLLLYIFFPFSGKSKKIRNSLLAIGILGVIFISFSFLYKDSALVRGNGILGRITSISASDTTAKTRLLAWEIGWQGFKEKPILGWGQENYNLVFSKYFNPEFYLLSPSETWFDQAHNMVVEEAVAGGVVGLLSYLFIFLAVIYLLIKKAKNSYGDHNYFTLCLLLISLLAIYFIQNLFVFDTINSLIMIFFVFGFIAFLTSGSGEEEGESKNALPPQKIKSVLIYLPALFILIIFYQYNIKPILVNFYTAYGYRQALAAKAIDKDYNCSRFMPDYKKAFAYGNYYDYQTGFEMTNIIMDTAEKANTDEEKEGCVQAFYFAAEEIQANVNISPLDAKNYMYLMRIYGALGKLGINPEENFKLAQEALDKGIALAPRRTEFYFSKSLIARDQGKYEEAIAAAQEAFKLSPTFGDSFWYLGLAYLDSGDKDKAKPLLKEALERGCGSDAVELISISQRFPLENNFDLLKLLYEKIVGLQPEDEQARLTLALIKKAGGDEDDYNKMKEELKAKGYEDKKFYAGVAICYVNLGATSEMEEAVRQAALAGLNLSFSENVIWRANLYIKLKRFDKAIAVYEEGIRNNPADPQLYASLAAVYKEMGNTLKAREVTLKILDLNPAYQEQVEEFLKILE